MRRIVFAVALAAGCGKESSTTPPDMAPPPDLSEPPDLAYDKKLIEERPYTSRAPKGYDPSKPAPLVILLHGFGGNGAIQEQYMGIGAYADTGGYLFANPDGTKDAQGRRFWNATDLCCDLGRTGVDDVAYLDAVISDMSARYNVDPKRVYLVGHSNGGFMSYRFACDRAWRVAAFVSLAGLHWKDMTKCSPSGPVAALQVHGDQDGTVPYAGLGNLAPSARDSAAYWAKKGGCGADAQRTGTLDLDTGIAGAETELEQWGGCASAGASLWTIKGGGHIPNLTNAWAAEVWKFLSAHARP